jgi:hypothetical protein
MRISHHSSPITDHCFPAFRFLTASPEPRTPSPPNDCWSLITVLLTTDHCFFRPPSASGRVELDREHACVILKVRISRED